MKNPRLFFLAIAFILIGFTGIIVATWFAGKHMFGDRVQPMMGMMDRTQMKGMMRSMMPGLVPPGIKPENLPEPESRGARLLSRYCSQCHDLPSPFMHSAGEWPATADRMFSRMEMMAGMQGMMDIDSPSAGEREAILGYLQKHSMQSITPDKLPLPGSHGASLFSEKCTRCHALPNPNLHTVEEWPGVVERMQANMRSMGKTIISEDEKKAIAGYLASQARR